MLRLVTGPVTGLVASLVIGLVTGLVTRLVTGLVTGPVTALVTYLVTGIVTGLVTGLLTGLVTRLVTDLEAQDLVARHGRDDARVGGEALVASSPARVLAHRHGRGEGPPHARAHDLLQRGGKPATCDRFTRVTNGTEVAHQQQYCGGPLHAPYHSPFAAVAHPYSIV